DNLAEIAEKDQADQLGTAGVSPVHETPPPAKGSSTKSVKCTDCGTLNLPTEWYCEKCGAELTAL
ncbi:MAG: zinc ribbon domain-containing protein, partial [Gemmatimonadota bacterium]|nr:zinc ribbon domain-containing protein [Gemmatimonadota bacterium]